MIRFIKKYFHQYVSTNRDCKSPKSLCLTNFEAKQMVKIFYIYHNVKIKVWLILFSSYKFSYFDMLKMPYLRIVIMPAHEFYISDF